jgi:hypothetical protein
MNMRKAHQECLLPQPNGGSNIVREGRQNAPELDEDQIIELLGCARAFWYLAEKVARVRERAHLPTRSR